MKKLFYLFVITLSAAVYSCKEKETDPWREMADVYNAIVAPVFPDRDFIMTNYHNPADTLYTEAIRKAIEHCAAEGGGRVVIPDGEFLTGPVRLRSRVNLHLADGARLLFVTDPHLFDVVRTRIEGIDCYNLSPLIYVYEETHIAITGNGVMDGQASEDNWFGRARRMRQTQPDGTRTDEKSVLYQMKADQTPFEERIFRGEEGIRPQFINLYKCRDVLLEGFTLLRSPFWLIHPLLSENVTVRGVKMISHGNNNDGCDPESCKNVLIEGCYFDTGDDCIAIKSGRDEDGRFWNIPCENIIVRDCVMKDGHAGVAIGSEVTGGCYNVWVENCRMDSPRLDRVIRIKSSAERGGEVKNVYVRRIEVGECRQSVLGMELKYWGVTDGPYPPYFHNIHLEHITSNKSQYVMHLDGFDDKIRVRDIYVKNCAFNGVAHPDIHMIVGVENIRFDHVSVNGQEYEGIYD